MGIDEKNIKIILVIVAVVVVAGIVGGLLAQMPIPPYKVADKEDISVPGATRLGYRVVVEPGISEKGAKLVARDLVNKVKNEIDFNAIVILMYDREEDIDDAYTITRVEYLPYGEWGKDTESRAGDYSKHKFVYDIRKKVTGPSIERPTEREFEIYDRCDDLLYEYHESIPDVSTLSKEEMVELAREITKTEEGIAKQVAEEFAITVEEVKGVYAKVVLWQLY